MDRTSKTNDAEKLSNRPKPIPGGDAGWMDVVPVKSDGIDVGDLPLEGPDGDQKFGDSNTGDDNPSKSSTNWNEA